MRVNAFSALFKCLAECRQRRQRAPGHRKRREIEMAHRLIVTDHKRHRLAAKARELSASTGWSAKGEITPKQFAPGTSLAVKTATIPDKSVKCPDVAENKRRVRVRRTDHARDERLRRPLVRDEDFRSGELADAVEAGNATANRGLSRQFRDVAGVEKTRLLHGVEDRAIASAAAKHARERVLDRLFVRPRLSSQQSNCG